MIDEAGLTPLNLPFIYAEVDSADLASTEIDLTLRDRPARMNSRSVAQQVDERSSHLLLLASAGPAVSLGIVGGFSALGLCCGMMS